MLNLSFKNKSIPALMCMFSFFSIYFEAPLILVMKIKQKIKFCIKNPKLNYTKFKYNNQILASYFVFS